MIIFEHVRFHNLIIKHHTAYNKREEHDGKCSFPRSPDRGRKSHHNSRGKAQQNDQDRK